MLKNLGSLIELFPVISFFESFGIDNGIAEALGTITYVLVTYLIIRFLFFLNNYYTCYHSAKHLSPWYDIKKIKSAKDFFIPTKFQNFSPTGEEEPAYNHRFVAKNELIPFLIKTVFNGKKESDKFYIVLADSGMGKTTFMINLYLRCTSVYNFNRNYNIRLFPFDDSRILERIKDIDILDVPNTILLLDSLDADRFLLTPQNSDGISDDDRFRRRLDEIIDVVRDFRKVIITSRTQYFTGIEDQLYELKIPRYDNNGFHTFAKLYLSPFDNNEIKRYLYRKYGIFRFWNKRKKQNARAIIRNAPQLMVRPMLLGYIDYLTDNDLIYETSFQIYESLITKWIEREAAKRKYKTVDRKKFIKDLHCYSQLVALTIYSQREQNGMLFLSREAALKVAQEHAIDLRDYEITGQSLLTRDSMGNWKFAHKSIFEYFISKEAIQNPNFIDDVNFTGYEMVNMFLDEAITQQLSTLINGKLEGHFRIKGGNKQNLHQFKSAQLNDITHLEIDNWNDKNNYPLIFIKFKNLKDLVLKNVRYFNINFLNGLNNLKVLQLTDSRIFAIDKLIHLIFNEELLFTEEKLDIFINNIDSNTIDNWMNYLNNNQSKITNLSLSTKNKLMAIKWYQNPLNTEVLLTPHIDDIFSPSLPSKQWWDKLFEVRLKLIDSKGHHNIVIKKEAFEKFNNTLNDFIKHTLSNESNNWARYYIIALNKWKRFASNKLKEIDIDSQSEQKIAINVFTKKPLSPERNANLFVGRDDLINELRTQLLLSDNLPIYLIQGQRRVGKTSLLKFLPILLKHDFEIVYFDIQGAISSIPDWLEKLREKINAKFSLNEGLWKAPNDWVNALGEFIKYVNIIQKQLNSNLIFAIDEYEELHEHLQMDQIQARKFLGALRNFLQHQNTITFLFAGAAFFNELENPNWNEYFVSFEKLTVDYLSKENCLKLISFAKLDIDNNVRDDIYDLTQGHPELVQMICMEIIRIANINNSPKIHNAQLQNAINNCILQPQNGIIDVFWTQFCKSNKMKEVVLKIANADNDIINNPKSTEDQNNIRKLLNHSYIVKNNSKHSIRIPLFEQWLKIFG
jgi:hypothetical protein